MPSYSHAKCRVLRPVPHGSLLGDRIFNSSRVFCSCLPSLQIGSPQRPPVLAVGGCWRCPPRRAAQRGARSVFTRSLCCWRIVTLPGKNPVSLRVRRLAGITLVFTGGPGAGVQLYLVSFKHPDLLFPNVYVESHILMWTFEFDCCHWHVFEETVPFRCCITRSRFFFRRSGLRTRDPIWQVEGRESHHTKYFQTEGRKGAGLRWEEVERFGLPERCLVCRLSFASSSFLHSSKRRDGNVFSDAQGTESAGSKRELPRSPVPPPAVSCQPLVGGHERSRLLSHCVMFICLIRISALNGFPSFWWKPSSHCSGS
ncbi:AN1-type zinc finger protein 6 isoform X1 [Lynx rufus]|uniref:AN1-type zinc finger protein 6 isoform X1 n=1 Tax=Lynx rufus TaxID=61384 RepID=UPI001F124C53|nr:AN1-type zinc finger protein 6 isoform X1 [Lynx rufus]